MPQVDRDTKEMFEASDEGALPDESAKVEEDTKRDSIDIDAMEMDETDDVGLTENLRNLTQGTLDEDGEGLNELFNTPGMNTSLRRYIAPSLPAAEWQG